MVNVQNSPTILLVVAAALSNTDGRILLQKRPKGKAMAGLWEFPGGKLLPGETMAAALCRELHEELGIVIAPEDLTPVSFVNAPLDDRQLLLCLYGARRWQGEPKPLEGQELGWFAPSEMPSLAMPPADYPLVEQLARIA
jgi:8-oxo-dGTP diphosphatase